jgi:large subunit ribosomal protein L25
LNSVTIKCKPSEIPEFLEVDVTDMEMNTNLFVKDIILSEDVEMMTAEDIAVMSVQEPKEEKEEEVSDEMDDDDESETTESGGGEESSDKTVEGSSDSADKSDGDNQ